MKPQIQKSEINDGQQQQNTGGLIKPVIQVEMSEAIDNQSSKTGGTIKTKKKKKKKKKKSAAEGDPSEIQQPTQIEMENQAQNDKIY